jgi:hypothetical protein
LGHPDRSTAPDNATERRRRGLENGIGPGAHPRLEQPVCLQPVRVACEIADLLPEQQEIGISQRWDRGRAGEGLKPAKEPAEPAGARVRSR